MAEFEKVFPATLSDMGPLALPVPLDFRTASQTFVDFTDDNERGKIDFISGVFVNNWNGEFDIYLQTNYPNSTIVIPQYSWGYFPLMVANPARFELTTPDGIIGAFVESTFYNAPIPPFVCQRMDVAPAP